MDPALACMLSFGLYCSVSAVDASVRTDASASAGTSGTVESAVTDGQPDGVASPESHTPPTGSASEVLAKVQKFYDATNDLRAHFRQTYVHPVYGTTSVMTGTVKIKKPGKMVWDYEKQSEPDFFADENTLWMVERETKQVVTTDVRKSDFSSAIKFLFGGQQLVRDFKVRHAPQELVTRYGMPGHHAVELKPKETSAHYKRLVLIVDAQSGRVDAFVVRNGDDSTNHFVLSDFAVNSALPEGDFTFRVPKGYTVNKE